MTGSACCLGTILTCIYAERKKEREGERQGERARAREGEGMAARDYKNRERRKEQERERAKEREKGIKRQTDAHIWGFQRLKQIELDSYSLVKSF